MRENYEYMRSEETASLKFDVTRTDCTDMQHGAIVLFSCLDRRKAQAGKQGPFGCGKGLSFTGKALG